MSEVQNPPADGVDSQAAKVLDTQKDNEKSQWDVEKNQSKNSEHQNGSERANHQNPRGSSRGQSRVGRGRGSKVSRGPRGRRQRGSADDDRSFPAHKTGDDVKEVRQVKEKSSRGPSKENGESASSHSENSEDDEDEDDEDEDEEADDDEEESQDDDEEEEHRPNDKTEEHENLDENVTVKDIQSPDTSTSKHAEASAKGLQKKQPYVRQVDLPKEKLSPADLEAKMAAMALKNAQLIEQKKAADQDAAEYREIELKSQRTFEAQRAQQQEIDAARKAAADRKLKKTQGREWDWEKTEDDWNRSRPYTDSMTNPNPGKHSWNNQRGSGSRGRPARGPHPRGRGAGRGGRGGARGHGGPESQKADQPSAHDNQSGPVQGQSASNGNDATPST